MEMKTRKRLLAAFTVAMALGAGVTLFDLVSRAKAQGFDPLSGLTLPTLTGWTPTIDPAASVTWYVKGNAGGRLSTASLKVGGFDVSETSARELTAGIAAGADYRIGNFIVGTFAGFDARVDHASAKLAGLPVLVPLGDMWSVGGRVGMFVGKAAMIYGLGGYAGLTERKIDVAGIVSSGHRNGVLAGGGLEFPFTPALFGSVEYRHLYLDTLPGAGGTSSRAGVDTLHFGVGYRFGVN